MIHEIAPDRYDPTFFDKKARETDWALAYDGNKVLAYLQEGEVFLTRFTDLRELTEAADTLEHILNNAYYLFSISGESYFLADPDLSGIEQIADKKALQERYADLS